MNTEAINTGTGQPEIPDHLGHYEIIEKIGQGGMAVVYKGLQPSLNRKVAVKLLPPQFVATPELLGRFDREASIVSRLNHSNIVQVIDRGKEGDLVYIVMEYVDGEGLDAVIKKGPMDTPTVVTYAMQICDALAYAHEMGVVHRDLKPSNILIDQRSGRVKIADFGIAQIEETGGLMATLTRDNASIGTMNYMSPEQRLDSHSVTHLTDIYALGVILYEMLIGKPPMGHFKLPSVVRPDIPLGFDSIVRECLSDSPTDRYQSAKEIRHDLSRLAGRHQKTDEPGSALLSLQRLNKRQRWHALAGVGGAILILAVLGGILATRDRTAPEPAPPPAPPTAAPGAATSVSRVDAELQADVARAEGLVAGEKMQEAVEVLEQALQAHPEARGAPDVHFLIAETYYAMDEKEKAKLEYQRLERQYPDSDRVPEAILERCRVAWETAARKGLLLRQARDAGLQRALIEELQALVKRTQADQTAIATGALTLIADIAVPPELEDYELAATSLLTLYEIDPQQGPEPMHRAAKLYREKLDDAQKAITVYKRLAKAFPDYARSNAIYERIGDLEIALSAAATEARTTEQTEPSSEDTDATP